MTARNMFCMPFVLAGILSGCSYSYRFHISGIVRSVDGQPLAGVNIVIDRFGDGSGSQAKSIESAADGGFSYEMGISSSEFANGRLPTRVLWLSKDGYVKERVDISPKQKPSSYTELVRILVEPRLKKSE